MAIQVRRGLEKDFDPEKALPGEWLLSTDTRYIRMCITPGVVLRMATYEAFESDMAKIQAVLTECKDIQSAINSIQAIVASKAALTVEYANSAAEYAKAAAVSEANAKMYAENASAVAGVGIATQDTAGLMKGGENYVDESGALVLTKTTTDTTLPNSHAGGIKLLGLYGASKQESTTGAQLLPCVIFGSKGVADNITWEISKEGFKASGTPNKQYSDLISADLSLAVGTYYISGGNRTDNLYARIAVVKNGVTSHYINTTFSIDGTEEIVNYAIQTGAEIVAINDTIYPMLNAGTTALPWEKFTGGAPSPSIDYPQEIKKSVVSEIWGHGKNFAKMTFGIVPSVNNGADVSVSPTVQASSDYMKVDSAKRYIGSTNGTLEGSYLFAYDVNKAFLGYISIGATIPPFDTLITTYPDTAYVRMRLDFKEDMSNSLETQFEQGTVATDYEPYKEFSHTLSQPIELNGINGVTDVLTPSGVERNMIKYIPTATAIANMGFSDTGRFAWFSPSSLLQPISASDKMCISTHFTETESDNIVNAKVDYGVYLDAGINIRIKDFTTLDEYKEYFTNNEVEFYYVAATPTFEPLPTADQIALNSLKSFDGTTYVYCDSEVQPTWEMEYGTSRVGALALENHCRENVHEIRLNELTTAMLVINQE